MFFVSLEQILSLINLKILNLDFSITNSFITNIFCFSIILFIIFFNSVNLLMEGQEAEQRRLYEALRELLDQQETLEAQLRMLDMLHPNDPMYDGQREFLRSCIRSINEQILIIRSRLLN